MAQIKNFLDYEGLEHLKTKLDTKLGTKADKSDITTLNNSVNSLNTNKLGKTENAVSSTKASAVVDYADTSAVVQIGWTGSSLATTDYFAAYSGNKIKDISVANAKKVLGVNSLETQVSNKVDTSTYNTKMNSLDNSINSLNTNKANKNVVDGINNRLATAESSLNNKVNTSQFNADISSLDSKKIDKASFKAVNGVLTITLS